MCGFKHLTMAELTDMMTAFRDACQARFPASDDAIDGMNFGKFPDDKDLKVIDVWIFSSFQFKFRVDFFM